MVMWSVNFSSAKGTFPGNKLTPESVQTITESKTKLTKPEFDMLIERLYEIKGMNVSAFNGQDKKELRKEVKAISHKIKADGVYFYLSGTAILIIILLLILL